MVTRQPDYNRQFRCLGGGCPDTCCRDWEIVLDEAALADYRQAPEPLRGQITASLVQDEEGDLCFRLRSDGLCALLTPEGLCPIQRDWGEAHLCAHCGAYPRFAEEYGCLTETALAVSCPEAARLLMERERFVLTEADDGGGEPPFDGVDPDLLAALERTRRLALAELDSGEGSVWRRLARVVELGAEVQLCIDFWDLDEAGADGPPGPKGSPLSRRSFAAGLMGAFGALEPLRPAWPALLSARRQELEGMGEGEYAALCARYERACPGWERRLANLGCYLVFRHWHKAVNDDELYGRAALIGAACLLLYHLAMLAWRERGALGGAEEALLWSAFSREAEHMEENWEALIELLSDRKRWPVAAALT